MLEKKMDEFYQSLSGDEQCRLSMSLKHIQYAAYLKGNSKGVIKGLSLAIFGYAGWKLGRKVSKLIKRSYVEVLMEEEEEENSKE